MARHYYYWITALPAPPHLGATPPMSPHELLEHVAEAPIPHALIEALLLGDDLLQREAAMAGECATPTPSVLTQAQMTQETPLPEYLVPGATDHAPRVAADATWAAYYRHTAAVAEQWGSEFLGAWTRHEVGLRNALAESRAKSLGLEPGDYQVCPDAGEDPEGFDAIIAEWSGAPDPLAGLKVLDRARWAWIDRNEAWFTFEKDELVAYGARLLLLNRWERLSESARTSASLGRNE